MLLFGFVWTGQFVYLVSGVSTNDKFMMKNYELLVLDLYDSSEDNVVRAFLKQTYKRTQNTIFVITPTGNIIGPISPPPEIAGIHNKPFDPLLFSEVMMVGDYFVYNSKSQSGKIFKIAIKISKSELRASFFVVPLYVRATFALIFMSFILNLLTSYYYSPLRKIMKSIEALSNGKLSTRIGSQLSNCSDDLRQYGANFDHMAEQLETLFLAKGEMFQHIIHELRTPLARAKMAIRLLENEVSAKGNNDYQVVKKQAIELSNLVDNILSLEKLRHGVLPISTKKFEVNKLVELIVNNANYETNQNRVKLTSVDHLMIKADKKLLESAIENITRNSLFHAGKDATILVTVSQKEEHCSISITDNGPGIEEEKLKTIFEPFIQAEKRRSGEGGYGLGLTIAKKIIILHQGQITMENIKPHGLSVTITIPL